MQKARNLIIRFIFPAALVFAINGCTERNYGLGRAKYERTMVVSGPIASGNTFTARTSDGYIRTSGEDIADCNVIATIIARAQTFEAAKELCDAVKISLEPVKDKLVCKIDRPRLLRNSSIVVNLDVAVPRHTGLELATSDGEITVEGIIGDVTAKTSDGCIHVTDINGRLNCRTSDGSIVCDKVQGERLFARSSDGNVRICDTAMAVCDVRTSDGNIDCLQLLSEQAKLQASDGNIRLTGATVPNLSLQTSDGNILARSIATSQLQCKSSDGSVHIQYARQMADVINARIVTSDGNVTFEAPENLSAVIEAHTADGSISSALPVTVQGKIGKSFKGRIGDGQGNVYLKTSDGSITIQ